MTVVPHSRDSDKSSTTRLTPDSGQPGSEMRALFHRLNNQLGIILAHAELLEAKAIDDVNRARAAQVVAATLEAMSTSREIRRVTESLAS